MCILTATPLDPLSHDWCLYRRNSVRSASQPMVEINDALCPGNNWPTSWIKSALCDRRFLGAGAREASILRPVNLGVRNKVRCEHQPKFRSALVSGLSALLSWTEKWNTTVRVSHAVAWTLCKPKQGGQLIKLNKSYYSGLLTTSSSPW